MRLSLNPAQTVRRFRRKWKAAQTRRLVCGYDFGGFKRMYFHHIRKTGGTSLIKMFMSLGGQDGNRIFSDLVGQADRPLQIGGMIYVGWDKRLIEHGEYAFGFSHIPFYQLKLPPGTFEFTCFRDPIARVVSHYRMLLDFSKQSNPHCSFATEGAWLGNSFDEFLDRMPREHLLNQLYMFSQSYSIDEAAQRVLALDHWLFLEDYASGLKRLGEKTKIKLRLRHDRKCAHGFAITGAARGRLRQMLDDEYQLLERVKNRNATGIR